MTWIRRRAKFLVALGSLIMCCAMAEVSLRVYAWSLTPMCVRLNDRRIYGLNPKFPGISSLGFRNREIAIPKPPGVYRVLILGDSVAFGIGVGRAEAFPQRMDALLGAAGLKVEVVNCGVPGYSTYNELELYQVFASTLQADLVMVAFCMNDVVNPRLHWATAGYALQALDNIPASAIPDTENDRRYVRPMLAERERVESQTSPVTHSLFISDCLDALMQFSGSSGAGQAQQIPTYLAFEDSTSIEVLQSDATPQWKWLMQRLGDLQTSVAASHAKLVILFFPLAYQMDRGYSLSPQKRLTDSCTANRISSVDILPILLGHTKAEMFRLANGEYYDIWHLTSFGHEVVAKVLTAYVLAAETSPKNLR